MQVRQIIPLNTLNDILELDIAGFVRTNNAHVAVVSVFASAEDMDTILSSPSGYVSLVNRVCGLPDVLKRKTFSGYDQTYVLVMPKTRQTAHYGPTFFRVERQHPLKSRYFILTRMLAVPHDIQPPKTDAVTRPMEMKWADTKGITPMGYALPAPNWDWQSGLAQVAMQTKLMPDTEFRLHDIFVMLDGRKQPKRDWPNFFSVADGGFGMSSTFRPLPMKLVEATDTLVPYVPHRMFDGW